jgi:ABC-2 type transport system permease protein
MLTQLRAELLKLATVRTTVLFVLASGGLAALLVVVQGVGAGSEFVGPLDDAATQRALFGSGEVVTLIAIVFGCLALSTEFRHHTIVTTFLAEPHRGRVVIAKAVGALVGGLALGATAVVVAVVGTWAVLVLSGTELVVPAEVVARGVGGTLAASALGSLFGMGIGGIVRNQALAVGATLLLLLAVEPLVGSIAPGIGRWLPSGLATTLASGHAGLVTVPAAVVALSAYGLVATALAVALIARADIT